MGKKVSIGVDLETNQPVRIEAQARSRSTYVIGITGTGKSSLLEQIAHQDIVNGDGILFLDPHGDSAEKILATTPQDRIDDVIFWDPLDLEHPLGLNPFSVHNPQDRLAVTRKADNFVAALGSLKEFAPIFESAPMMKNVLHNLALTFVVNQGRTLLETPDFLTNDDFRQSFYPRLIPNYQGVLQYWERFDQRKEQIKFDEVRSTLNKLERFSTNPVIEAIFSQETSIDFRAAMDQGKKMVVKLPGSGIEDTAAFVGAFIIWELLEAARSRADIEEARRRPFHVFADEFQTYLTTAFPVILEQARKYGLDVTIAHQVREQLEGDLRERVRAVGNVIVFRVTRPSAEALAGEFRVEIPEPAIHRLEPTYEIVAHALDYLISHPVKNQRIMDYHRVVVDTSLKLFEGAFTQAKIIGESWRTWRGDRYERYRPFKEVYPLLEGVTSSGFEIDLESRKKRFTEAIDTFIYRAMRCGQHKNEKPFTVFDWKIPGNMSVIMKAIRFVENLTHDLYDGLLPTDDKLQYHRGMEEIDDMDGVLAARCSVHFDLLGIGHHLEEAGDDYDAYRDAFWKLAVAVNGMQVGDPEKDKHLRTVNDYVSQFPANFESSKKEIVSRHGLSGDVVVIGEALANLAYQLHREPIFTSGGQLQPVPESRRLYSDVELEIANKLTNLRRFTALCKLESKDGVVNFEIATQLLDAPPNPTFAASIKRQSQQKYGGCPHTSRNKVGMIPRPKVEESILTQQQTSASATMDIYDQPIGDDSTVEFGEKKTAAASEKSRAG